MSYKKEVETIKFDGSDYYTLTYVPENVPVKAHVIVLHGLDDYGERHEEITSFLAKNGYNAFTFDQKGWGRSLSSPSVYGKTDNSVSMKELDFFIERELKSFNGPVFLMGSSMGGGMTLNYALSGTYREKLAGYIACCPAIKVHRDSLPNAVLFKILRTIGPFVPNVSYPVDFDPKILTSDTEYQKKILDDKLLLHKSTFGCLLAMFNRGDALLNPSNWTKFPDKPILVVHGTADKLTDPEGSKEFIENVKVSDKTLKLIENARHEMHHEIEPLRSEFLNTIKDWLDDHVKDTTSKL